jgi:nitroimidazol reductase NimA-like FMN-containing flavoprotein (pyridoxamine 5'-phosphate oxidase superfamily)
MTETQTDTRTSAPGGELDPRFSSPDATPTDWQTVRRLIDAAKTYWLATVRADGRPHATTIGGIWLDETFYFTTGPTEQKAINMASGHEHVVVVTGHNDWRGLDVVIEGEAMRVTDAERLRRLAEAFTAKYDDFFRLRESEGRLIWVDGADDAIEGRKDAVNDAGPVAFEVRASKVFAFAKGDAFSQTRWRFDAPRG